MNETTLFTTIFMSLLLFLVQRAEKKARRMAWFFALCIFLMIRHVAYTQGDESTAWIGLLIAAILNGLFWFFIGRYNPPKSSDSIQVIGMDD
jgi:lysylphosphatidylglycerol synthetase-like protein (DUF2156 family)